MVKTFWTFQSFQFYGYFQLVRILSFQKIYICLKKIFGTSELFKKTLSQIPLFHQISTLEPNFSMKFLKFHILILVMYSTTNNLSKTVYCIKIHQQMAEISWKEGWKTLYFSQKANKKSVRKLWFFSSFACFSTFFWWYFSHLLADFDAKYRFGKVISCRLHVWNLDVKF